MVSKVSLDVIPNDWCVRLSGEQRPFRESDMKQVGVNLTN